MTDGALSGPEDCGTYWIRAFSFPVAASLKTTDWFSIPVAIPPSLVLILTGKILSTHAGFSTTPLM
jgi:hypothetical protein